MSGLSYLNSSTTRNELEYVKGQPSNKTLFGGRPNGRLNVPESEFTNCITQVLVLDNGINPSGYLSSVPSHLDNLLVENTISFYEVVSFTHRCVNAVSYVKPLFVVSN